MIFHNQGNGLLLFHQKRSLHVKFYRPKFHGTRRPDSRFYPAARRSAQGLSCGSIHLSDHLIHRASRRDHRKYVVIGRNAAVNHHRLFESKGLLQRFFHLAVLRNGPPLDTEGLRKGGEIGLSVGVGLGEPPALKQLLPLAYHTQHLIVHDHHHDRKLIGSQGHQLV